MVRSHQNVTKLEQVEKRCNSINAILLFCTVVVLLSMPILRSTTYAQSQSNAGGGALGGLLSQLETLKSAGALDTLEGRSRGNLASARERGSAKNRNNEMFGGMSRQPGKLERERQRLFFNKQLLLGEKFCRGKLDHHEYETFKITRRFSPLEKDYCRRVGELLLQFGYDLFDQQAYKEYLDTGAIFPDYVLGIDDELVVTFMGRLNKSLNVRVDREGRILVPNFKPIFAAGHTFGKVRSEIAARTATTHLGTEVFVSLGSVRLVNVLVLGEVRDPGKKQLTALNTLIDAIRLGGGVKKTGSIRRIHVQRGDQIFWVDAYDLLFSGMTARDLALRNGDRVIVPPLGPTYALAGDVKRPGIYEMPDGLQHLTLAEAIKMSGGTIRPYGNLFHHLGFRNSGHQELKEHKNLAARVQDGDIIRVSRSQNSQLGAVVINGHVHVPGRRALAATPSIAALLGDVRSLRSNPYLLFAALETTDPKTRARRLFPINLKKILHGQEDYALQDDDRLIVLGADDVNYLSSANVQNVVSGRIDIELRQTILEVQSDKDNESSGDSGADKVAGNVDPLSVIQEVIAERSGPSKGKSVKSMAVLGIQNLDKALEKTCAGMRRLFNIVLINSSHRFSNVFRTIDATGTARIDRRDCPKIFDNFGGMLPLALEHAVSINGEVRQPGAYPIVGDVSLSDLISVAGGVSREADLTRVEISRYTPDALKGSSETTRGLINLAEINPDKVMIGPGDVVRFNAVASERDTGPVLLLGEFARPGLYEIRRGERLSEVIARAGGLTPQAYPFGGIFTRKRVQTEQTESLQRATRELSSALTVVAAKRGLNPKAITGFQQVATQLGKLEALGRIVAETDPTVLQVRPELDSVLEPGDRLYMPKRPNFVTVVGDVLNPGAQQFIAGTTADEYIQQAGGFQRSADEDRIFVVYPNGRAEQLALHIWNYRAVQLPPGSSLVVPKDPAPADIFTLVREGSSLISQLAVTAASLAVISRD